MLRLALRADDHQDGERLTLLKQAVTQEVKDQDSFISFVERSANQAIRHVETSVEAALQQALVLTEQRQARLVGEEEALQKSLDFLDWAEKLILPHSADLSPADWLQIWTFHLQLLRKTCSDFSHLQQSSGFDDSSMSARKTDSFFAECDLKVTAGGPDAV